jgi:hypothetical protein
LISDLLPADEIEEYEGDLWRGTDSVLSYWGIHMEQNGRYATMALSQDMYYAHLASYYGGWAKGSDDSTMPHEITVHARFVT